LEPILDIGYSFEDFGLSEIIDKTVADELYTETRIASLKSVTQIPDHLGGVKNDYQTTFWAHRPHEHTCDLWRSRFLAAKPGG
jgi:hypothetical protein